MRTSLSDNEGEIRVMGTAAFIEAVAEKLGQIAIVHYDGNLRPNQYGEGQRAHMHIRLTDID
ncbi:hypothetical protein D5S17_23360 [Pseudonocardiaceae bacterium YIM PH 21723]|nr:hypothetical protein D5S17_23360 [Pseudonocardiaceae bacterium YIM PH 21723]